eukprot:gene47472-60992_t
MLTIGSIIGRLLGLALVDLMQHSLHTYCDGVDEWVDPGHTHHCVWSVCAGTFALVGAAAFFAGVSRLTFSLCVIMLELSNDLAQLPTVMIGVMIAKTVADNFTHSLYHALLEVKCVPFLDYDCNLAYLDVYSAGHLMSKVTDITMFKIKGEMVRKVISVLQHTDHNGYPVVGIKIRPGRFKGLVQRKQLCYMVHFLDAKRKEIYDNQPEDEKDPDVAARAAVNALQEWDYEDMQTLRESMFWERKDPDDLPEWEAGDPLLDQLLDLTFITNTSAFSVPKNFCVTATYTLFRIEERTVSRGSTMMVVMQMPTRASWAPVLKVQPPLLRPRIKVGAVEVTMQISRMASHLGTKDLLKDLTRSPPDQSGLSLPTNDWEDHQESDVESECDSDEYGSVAESLLSPGLQEPPTPGRFAGLRRRNSPAGQPVVSLDGSVHQSHAAALRAAPLHTPRSSPAWSPNRERDVGAGLVVGGLRERLSGSILPQHRGGGDSRQAESPTMPALSLPADVIRDVSGSRRAQQQAESPLYGRHDSPQSPRIVHVDVHATGGRASPAASPRGGGGRRQSTVRITEDAPAADPRLEGTPTAT